MITLEALQDKLDRREATAAERAKVRAEEAAYHASRPRTPQMTAHNQPYTDGAGGTEWGAMFDWAVWAAVASIGVVGWACSQIIKAAQ